MWVVDGCRRAAVRIGLGDSAVGFGFGSVGGMRVVGAAGLENSVAVEMAAGTVAVAVCLRRVLVDMDTLGFDGVVGARLRSARDIVGTVGDWVVVGKGRDSEFVDAALCNIVELSCSFLE